MIPMTKLKLSTVVLSVAAVAAVLFVAAVALKTSSTPKKTPAVTPAITAAPSFNPATPIPTMDQQGADEVAAAILRAYVGGGSEGADFVRADVLRRTGCQTGGYVDQRVSPAELRRAASNLREQLPPTDLVGTARAEDWAALVVLRCPQ